MSDTQKEEHPEEGARAGIVIDESKIQVVRHPDNAHLKSGNDKVQGEEDEKPSE
jgi:hypothetical protein